MLLSTSGSFQDQDHQQLVYEDPLVHSPMGYTDHAMHCVWLQTNLVFVIRELRATAEQRENQPCFH